MNLKTEAISLCPLLLTTSALPNELAAKHRRRRSGVHRSGKRSERRHVREPALPTHVAPSRCPETV